MFFRNYILLSSQLTWKVTTKYHVTPFKCLPCYGLFLHKKLLGTSTSQNKCDDVWSSRCYEFDLRSRSSRPLENCCSGRQVAACAFTSSSRNAFSTACMAVLSNWMHEVVLCKYSEHIVSFATSLHTRCKQLPLMCKCPVGSLHWPFPCRYCPFSWDPSQALEIST